MIKRNRVKRNRRHLESVLRKLCFRRDGNECLMCGNREKLQMSHIYPKGAYPWMRYEFDNVKTLCYRCHFHIWHKSPIEAYEWAVSTIEPSRLEKLKKLSELPKEKRVKFNYQKILDQLMALV